MARCDAGRSALARPGPLNAEVVARRNGIGESHGFWRLSAAARNCLRRAARLRAARLHRRRSAPRWVLPTKVSNARMLGVVLQEVLGALLARNLWWSFTVSVVAWDIERHNVGARGIGRLLILSKNLMAVPTNNKSEKKASPNGWTLRLMNKRSPARAGLRATRFWERTRILVSIYV